MCQPRVARAHVQRSAFAGFRFPPEVITLAVRWYLRYSLSYRDLEELLAERGVEVDHVTVYRWVQRFTPLFADAARPLRQQPDRSRSWTAEGSATADAGLKRLRSAARLAAGHAFVQNLRRGHYELATDIRPPLRLAVAFSELALTM